MSSKAATATAAAAVFSIGEFSKRLGIDSQDQIKESIKVLKLLNIKPSDAGIIKDSSGGMIWFSAAALDKLNNHLNASKSKYDISASKIQAVWRGYNLRRKLKANKRTIRTGRTASRFIKPSNAESNDLNQENIVNEINSKLLMHVSNLSTEYSGMVHSQVSLKELIII